MGIATARAVSTEDLKKWRMRAARRGGRRNRSMYGVSTGARSGAPVIDPNEDGTATVTNGAVGPPLEGRELVLRMEARRQAFVNRVSMMTPDAKYQIVQHLRQANPGLLAAYPNDEEGNKRAIAHLNDLVRQESEQIAQRALIRAGRAHTILYGGVK